MLRIPNTRPTSIYWLIDTRPGTIRAGWTRGLPFYCGKTVDTPQKRFHGHNSDAIRKPDRVLSQRINACGRHMRIQVMEVVPAHLSWVESEVRWIKQLRLLFPETCNIAAGGAGSPGVVQSAETIAKIKATKNIPVFMSPEEQALRTARKIMAKKRRAARKRDRLKEAKKRKRRLRPSAKMINAARSAKFRAERQAERKYWLTLRNAEKQKISVETAR
jgi:hypothetical protein